MDLRGNRRWVHDTDWVPGLFLAISKAIAKGGTTRSSPGSPIILSKKKLDFIIV